MTVSVEQVLEVCDRLAYLTADPEKTGEALQFVRAVAEVLEGGDGYPAAERGQQRHQEQQPERHQEEQTEQQPRQQQRPETPAQRAARVRQERQQAAQQR